MGRKDQNESGSERVETVLQLLRKQSPLAVKQEKFCNYGCVERFLKVKGDNVKKAAKYLRACLSWRESIGIDYLTADEFSGELSDGAAYLSGSDDESRPVLVLRIKQDYQKLHFQKVLTRLVVFTLEVAIGTMPRNVDQLVLLFDASYFRSASAFMNMLLAILKIVGEYYPGRLHKAFVIDPPSPSLFSCLWKGVRPFVELSTITNIVSSLDYEDSLEFDDFSTRPSSSLRFDSSSIKSTAKVGSCSSSRFAFTVSHNYDSLKPWYLTLTDTSSFKVDPTPLSARSLSFASPANTATPRGDIRKSFFPSTPLPMKTTAACEVIKVAQPRTPGPSFFQSPAMFFSKKESGHVSKTERSRESFVPFLKFYRRPYDEMSYRSKMRPPIGGLISIVPSHLKRRHMSVSQRF